MKKRILFLSFNFPFGPFGPSTNCMTRIMEALSEYGGYEVFNLSYDGAINHYRDIKDVNIKRLPLTAPHIEFARARVVWNIIFNLFFYPFANYFYCRKVYKACKESISKTQYDLIIAQCNPEESVWTGTWIKRSGYGGKLMVIFWDNIYGKMQQRIIPDWLAIRRQRKAEKIIAKYSDVMVSLYPIKYFHTQYGDVPEASAKRIYLGIPSIMKPKQLPLSSFQKVIKAGKINILYSGTIFSIKYVKYVVELFNKSKYAETINLVFFARGVDLNDIIDLRKRFSGSIEVHDWIPLDELLSIYPSVDFFMSYPGIPTAIRSKVFEYMSYGKPLLLFYDNDNDVNTRTFSIYPACKTIDMRKDVSEYERIIDRFLQTNKNRNVPFEVTEQLFPNDSPQAYVRIISNLVK